MTSSLGGLSSGCPEGKPAAIQSARLNLGGCSKSGLTFINSSRKGGAMVKGGALDTALIGK